MPDTTPSKALTRQALRQTQTSIALASILMPRVKDLKASQEQILDETESFAKAWFARRHTAASTGAEALQQMGAVALSDPSAAMKVMGAWQAGSMGRIAQDFSEWSALCMTCANRTLKAEADAGRALIKDATSQSTTPETTAKDHSTPV